MLIKSVNFIPGGTFRGQIGEYSVVAVLEDDTTQPIGRYFTDEKSYYESDFVGLTIDQAHKKFLTDDVNYLRG